MKKRSILICTVFLGLVTMGCKKPSQQSGVSAQATNTEVTENQHAENQQKANTPDQILAKPEVPILCYHRIADGKKGDYTVSPSTFSAHMKVLADSGYHSISPVQLYDYLVYNKTLPEKPVMITFDDSRLEHCAIAAPVMEKYGFKGVFFIMTITYNKKNYMTREQIAQLDSAGHTIGLHTWDHTMVTRYKDAADWQKQIADPKDKLEKIIGKPVGFFAYPNGVYDHKGAEKLSHYFKISFTLFSKRDSLQPLQTVRRMIAPESTPQGLLKSMRRTFKTL
jgi:Predicted xylanase/chitin deacetylase